MRILVLPFALPLITLAVGCGPTPTAGTQGVPVERLAVLHVNQQYDVPVMQLAAVGFDGGEMYDLNCDRDFYLTPGVHHLAIDLAARIDSPVPLLPLGSTTIQGPRGLATGDLQPGKTYELQGLGSTLQLMAASGDMAITRETAPK